MADDEWFLLKAQDKEVYGPVTLDVLKSWAVAAKVSPMDRVSNDGQTSWVRAPMVSALQMDWLIELEDDYLYGPTSLATIQEFIESGEITATDNIINCVSNERMQLDACPTFTNTFAAPEEAEATPVDPVKQINRLEGLVAQLRTELTRADERYSKLLAEFREATGREPS